MQKKWTNQTKRMAVVWQSLLCLMVLAWPAAATAQQCVSGKGIKPVGAVNSSNGGVYEKGQYGIIFKYTYYNQDKLYEGNDEVDFTRPQQGQEPGKKCCKRTT